MQTTDKSNLLNFDEIETNYDSTVMYFFLPGPKL